MSVIDYDSTIERRIGNRYASFLPGPPREATMLHDLKMLQELLGRATEQVEKAYEAGFQAGVEKTETELNAQLVAEQLVAATWKERALTALVRVKELEGK